MSSPTVVADLPPTRLDLHETNVDPAPAKPSEPTDPRLKSCSNWRHTGWAGIRHRVREAMLATCQPYARITRYDQCGDDVWIVRAKSDPSRIRLSGNYCRDRLCQPCSLARGRRIADRLRTLCEGHSVRLVTLTLRHEARPLNATLDHLYASYRRLRQAEVWRDNVSAAAAVVEVTRNRTAGTWHAHLHVLTVGSYLPKPLVLKAWLHATGTSYVVDLSRVRDHRQAIRYLTTYLTKLCDARTYCDPDALAEYVVAIAGRRLVLVTGAWHNAGLVEDPPEEEWETVDHLSSVLHRCRHGDPDALSLLRRLTVREDHPWQEHPP